MTQNREGGFTEVNTAVSEVYLSVITGAKPLEELDKLWEQAKQT